MAKAGRRLKNRGMYQAFAQVYDLFMEETPYNKWYKFITCIFDKFNISKGDIVLDLGCGSGTLTTMLSGGGYDMIGVDSSVEMLQAAMEKKPHDRDILYLCQDLRSFELYGTVSAIISTCDCMNYILDAKELVEVFSLAYNYMDPGGIFIFDMNTPYKYEKILSDNIFAENTDSASYIWENYYDPKRALNTYCLSMFIREDGDIYRKYEEVHCQRSYLPDEVERLLDGAGFTLEALYDDYTFLEPKIETERICYVARR